MTEKKHFTYSAYKNTAFLALGASSVLLLLMAFFQITVNSIQTISIPSSADRTANQSLVSASDFIDKKDYLQALIALNRLEKTNLYRKEEALLKVVVYVKLNRKKKARLYSDLLGLRKRVFRNPHLGFTWRPPVLDPSLARENGSSTIAGSKKTAPLHFCYPEFKFKNTPKAENIKMNSIQCMAAPYYIQKRKKPRK